MKLSGSTLVLGLAVGFLSSAAHGEARFVHRDASPESVAVRQPAENLRNIAPIRPRLAPISTANHLRPIHRVSRYQNALNSANGVHLGRTSALARNGSARLNRFVFRRTAPAAVDARSTRHVVGDGSR